MKIFHLFLSLAILSGLFLSCSNEIDIYSDDAPDMLFVLGCIDGTGSLQQVKIRKMIAGNEDASRMINDPSQYLPDTSIRVFLEDGSGYKCQLKRVIHPPQTGGAFSQDSNLIYEIAGYQPTPGKPCFLHIDNPANGKEVSATLNSLVSSGIYSPSQELAWRSKFNFTDTRSPFRVSYSLAPASILTISIKYVDFLFNGEEICRKANYNLPPALIPYPSDVQMFDLDHLWRIFNSSIQEDHSVDYRMFYRFDFTIWTADSVIANYLYTAARFDDNRRLSFYNIQGGMGLFFSTSNSTVKNVCPWETFLDFLASNSTTTHLNFSRYFYSGNYADPDSVLVNPFFPGAR